MQKRLLRKSTATTNQLSDRQLTRIVYITSPQTVQIPEKNIARQVSGNRGHPSMASPQALSHIRKKKQLEKR
jgi:hypothetical protein